MLRLAEYCTWFYVIYSCVMVWAYSINILKLNILKDIYIF